MGHPALVLPPQASRPKAPSVLAHGLLPDTNRRFVKERSGPDLDERALFFSVSQKRAIGAEKSIPFSAHRRGTIVVAVKRTLNESAVQEFSGRSPSGAP